jgi:hypothetical protein
MLPISCSVAKVDPLDGVDRVRLQPRLPHPLLCIFNRVADQEGVQFRGSDFQNLESGLPGNPYVRFKVTCHRGGAVESKPHDFTL